MPTAKTARHRTSAVLIIAAAAFLLVALLPSAGAVSPLVITRGGVYEGKWECNDPATPVVVIKTSEPVTIQNATLRGRGDLIVSDADHVDLTVRNVSGYGLNPNKAGKCAGRFARIEQFDRIVIENCRLEGTAGIYLLNYAGDRSPKQSIRIANNRAKNIDGRHSDGKGGYAAGAELVQFVQFDKVRNLSGVEIAWNEVINEPGVSCVEDNISMYLSSGTSASPIRIHDNFIRGAYPIPIQGDFSGGGIMLGDGEAKSADDLPAYVIAEGNQVLDTVNYGIAISAGHDCAFSGNRIISAGVLADGQAIAAQNVGAYIWDSHRSGANLFFNNSGRDNLIGWIKAGSRNDWWRPGASAWENNTNWPDPITIAVYEQEWERWQEKLKQAGQTVGPQAAGPTTVGPKTAP